LIVTGISEQTGWPAAQVQQRDAEIAQVAELVGFSQVFNLCLPAMQLDSLPMMNLIAKISSVFKSFQPEEVLLPHRYDVHTDHRIVFDAAVACTKWFRYPSVRRVLAYETISETESSLNQICSFYPNYFVDITDFLERKLEVIKVYQSEMGEYPFPRSIEAISALAAFRGSTAGFFAAEAFQLLRERQ
jgi:LmbE family N-acetylglucosaminyl deacetylase